MDRFTLPDGYSLIKTVDLQKEKKLAVLVNAMALVIAATLIGVGVAINPINFVLSGTGSLLRPIGVLAAVIVYMVLHELVHGAFIKKFSGKKAKYGFTGLYAYAGSDAFLNKREYIIVALAPVVLLGAVLLLANIILSAGWFWSVYLLQTVNISGAAGDFYITYILGKLPPDLLIQDEGFTMKMYSRMS